MEIITFTLGPVFTNAYLLVDERTSEALLVDAPPGAYEVIKEKLEEKGGKLMALLLTHGHWDHVIDAHLFVKDGVSVYAHKGDAEMIEAFAKGGVHLPPGIDYVAPEITHWVEEGDTLEFLGEKIDVCHIPGHSPGSIAFCFSARNIAFTGDLIFLRGIGRYDLPGSDFEILMASIQEKIYTLPDETVLYTGHGAATTVGHEKAENPFTRAP